MQQTSTYRWARVSDQALAWHLRRNCSVTPRQLGGWYATLCLLSLLIGSGFWVLGMPLVLAFAGLELLAVGVALLVYARHALDGETVRLQGGRLSVERECAGRRETLEFGAAGAHPHAGARAGLDRAPGARAAAQRRPPCAAAVALRAGRRNAQGVAGR